MRGTTLVLVHGGSVTSTMWDPVRPFLAALTATPDLPGRRHRPADLGRVTRLDWERSVVADIEALGCDRVVLAGHSSGGYVIPGVAARLPPGMVAHLVFVAATCPVEGQRPVDALTPKLHELAAASQDYLRERAMGRTLDGRRPGEPPIDTDLEVIAIEPRMGVEAPSQLFEPMTWIGVPDGPRTYIRAMRDRVIPPDHAQQMAVNAQATTVIDLDADHDIAGSAPEALAEVLDRITAAS